MAGTRAPFASLLALAAVASVQAEPAEKSATDASKQDALSIPTLRRPVEGTEKTTLFPGSSALPELSIAPANPGRPSPKTGDETAGVKSAGWLVDGVNKLEAEAAKQRDEADYARQNDRFLSSSSSDSARRDEPATINPFAEYMTSWLSPGDQALLNNPNGSRTAASSSTAPWEPSRIDFGAGIGTSGSGVNAKPLELAGAMDFGARKETANPYLEDPSAAESPAIAAAGSGPQAGEAPSALPSILIPSQTVLPPAASPEIERAQPAPAAPPTEPLIDDRKYFPQLRRF